MVAVCEIDRNLKVSRTTLLSRYIAITMYKKMPQKKTAEKDEPKGEEMVLTKSTP